LDGTEAHDALDDNATENPPAGAFFEIVTVPVVGSPPTTVVGVKESEEMD